MKNIYFCSQKLKRTQLQTHRSALGSQQIASPTVLPGNVSTTHRTKALTSQLNQPHSRESKQAQERPQQPSIRYTHTHCSLTSAGTRDCVRSAPWTDDFMIKPA